MSQLSAAESLRLIENMIQKTRKEISDQSPYFLVWGWCAMLASIGQYLLSTVFKYPHHYIVWLITIPCVIFTIWFARRDSRRTKVLTYIHEYMIVLWTAVGVSFFIISMLFFKIGWHNCYPFYMLLYGLGSFVSGRILQFRPFIIGGIISWVLAIVSVWFEFRYQALFGAAALLFSYIIPGHLIRREEIRKSRGIV